MKRHQDWPSRLEGYLQDSRDRPFRWGWDDCCLWACGAVAVMTGVDVGAPFRGRYRSAFAARLVLKAFGGGGLPAAVQKIAARYGKPEVAPLSAQRGDLCLAGSLDGISGLGICLGSRAAFLTPAGLVFVPMPRIKRAWRV